jgi:tetratricopeptide (TPR) repeat protein
MRVFKRALRPTRLVGLAILLVLGGLALGVVRKYQAIQSSDHLRQARAALKQGDENEALAQLAEAVRLNPAATDAHRERAGLHARHRRWDVVVADCTAALRFAPDDADLHVRRAEALVYLGGRRDSVEDFEQAAADATAALRADPSLASAYRFRALGHSGLFDDDQALADAREAVRLAPDDAETLLARGQVRAARGEDAEAVKDFNEALRLDPGHARAHARRGLSRLEVGDRAGALADCTRAVELAPQDATGYAARARVHIDARRFAEALADLDRARELEPSDVITLCVRGMCHLARHASHKALADTDAALAVNPWSPSALAVRALSHLDSGKKTWALADMGTAAARQPRSPFVQMLWAMLLHALGRQAEAIDACAPLLKRAPKDAADAFALRALCRLHQGDAKGAVEECTRAIDLAPEDAGLYALRGVAHERAGAAEADRDRNRAYRIDRARACLVRFQTYLALKVPGVDLTAAADEAVRLNPADADVYLDRATAALEKMTKVAPPDRWRQDCDRALQLAPDDPHAYRLRAAGLSEAKDYDSVVRDCTKALEIDPEDVAALVLRAEAHRQRTRTDLALADASAALGLESESAGAYAVRGLVYIDQGREDLAGPDLARAAQLDKQFKELNDNFERRTAMRRLASGQFDLRPIVIPQSPWGANAADRPAEPFRGPSTTWYAVVIPLAVLAFLGALAAGVYRARRA